MTITVPELPYAKNALEPHMSERTVEFHYEKHHKGYAKKLEAALKDHPDFADLSLEDMIRKSAGKKELQKDIFNNAAQVWNHTFYWEGMTPDDPGKPEGKLAEMVDNDFGDVDTFKETFVKAGEGRFGSGYAWLVLDHGRLKVVSTLNAETPLTGDVVPLLCCDVWEHAYYLDVQNDRAKFMKTFVDNLINWAEVAKRLDAAPEQAFKKAA